MIKLFVMDVDGTMTDGGIYYDCQGNEWKKFNVKDGAGIQMLHEAGIETMILTGRSSECVTKRGKELGVTYLVQGQGDKAEYLQNFMKIHKFSREEVAYIGDDLNDLKCFELVGYTACPNDAHHRIQEAACFISAYMGGQGAVRESIETILK